MTLTGRVSSKTGDAVTVITGSNELGNHVTGIVTLSLPA
jgi:hypothetical protein